MNGFAHRAPEPVHRTILVPLDGSHLGDGALPTARTLAARFGATIHTFTVTVSDFELQRIRAEAAHALGTDPDDPRIHVEVDADVAAAVDRCASQLDSELGLPVAAAWSHTLAMKLTLVTVAEPRPPPVCIGAPWRRHHGPNEDADEYVRRLGEQWALAAPGLDTFVVYDPISAAAGMKDYLAAHPTGLKAFGWSGNPVVLAAAATATVRMRRPASAQPMPASGYAKPLGKAA